MTITTEPNQLRTKLHNRMPVILAARDFDRWMAPADPARLPIDLLRPCDADLMASWKVSSAVGKLRNDSPELCKEVFAPTQRSL
jgi:putative SOS response-associated peptidase YedK